MEGEGKARKKTARVAAIIPAHNGIEDTLRCVESLRGSHYPVAAIIVVDDGSTDGTGQRLAESFPEVVVARAGGDLWWSGAVNRGLEIARTLNADHYLLVNQDNVVPAESVGELVASVERNPAAIIGSVVVDLDEPTRVGFCGGAFEWGFRTWRMFHWELEEMPALIESETMTGMATLIPAEVVARIGGMDAAAFPQYWGDTDFAVRARASGFRVLIEPKSLVMNRVASTGHVKIAQRWRGLSSLKRMWDMRSPFDIRTTARFYHRHCPHRLTAAARLAVFYSSLAFYTAAQGTSLMSAARRLLPIN